MAWTGSGADRFRRRRPPAAAGEDRISALSDDLLLLVLRRLDTRSALGTAVLSSRWASLPRELPALDFSVGDILPPRYHRWIRLHRDPGSQALFTERKHIVPSTRRYERRAMRALASSIEGILAGDDRRRRRLNRLRLDFFATDNSDCCVNRLIAKAVDAWGVDDLEAVARPSYCRRRQAHTFPSHGLCKEPRKSRLRRLKLGGCVLPPMHQYSALTTLLLQDLPESTPAAAYEGLFTSCQQLQVLHLNSCGCSGDQIVVVDAPMSEIRELLVDHCTFRPMLLRALPNLESLASLQTRVYFDSSSSCPSLRQWNFALRLGVADEQFRQTFKSYLELELDLYLQCTPDLTNMIIRFTGPDRWFVPSSSPSLLLPNLRRLLVADVPSSWDVAWPRLLLEMAPLLEILHIHVTPCTEEPSDELSWQPTKLRQHHLKEFVMAGFEGTERQIYLVRFVMEICTSLQRVSMFKNGYARDKGHWDWEMVTQQYSWSDKEKDTMLKQIMDGVSSSTAPCSAGLRLKQIIDEGLPPQLLVY